MKNMQKHFRTRFLTRPAALSLALAPTLALAQTGGQTDPTAQLGSAATTAITTVAGIMVTVLVAAFVIPVGKRAYSVIKSCFTKAG